MKKVKTFQFTTFSLYASFIYKQDFISRSQVPLKNRFERIIIRRYSLKCISLLCSELRDCFWVMNLVFFKDRCDLLFYFDFLYGICRVLLSKTEIEIPQAWLASKTFPLLNNAPNQQKIALQIPIKRNFLIIIPLSKGTKMHKGPQMKIKTRLQSAVRAGSMHMQYFSRKVWKQVNHKMQNEIK